MENYSIRRLVMKWYRPIPCDNTVKNPLVCSETNLITYQLKEEHFLSGEKIMNWNDDIFFKSDSKICDGTPDDAVQNSMMLPIYSNRLINEIFDAGINGIQFLPIKIQQSDGENIPGFSVANVLNVIDAFDFERSVFDRFEDDFPNPHVRGQIAGVLRFVLIEGKLDGHDIIRLKEYPLAFFVSEKFKRMFVANRFTGYSFSSVELS